MGASEIFEKAHQKHDIIDQSVLHNELQSLTAQDWKAIASDYPQELALAHGNLWVEDRGDKMLVHNEESIRRDRTLTDIGDFLKGICFTAGGGVVGKIGASVMERDALMFGAGGALVGLGIAYAFHRSHNSEYDKLEHTANPLTVPLSTDTQTGMLEKQSTQRSRMLASGITDINLKSARA